MTSIQLLDCTLRDGGYLVNKNFNENAIHNIVIGLTQAGVDYVELGFLQDEIGEKENVCFRNSVDARRYIPKNRGNTLYTASPIIAGIRRAILMIMTVGLLTV